MNANERNREKKMILRERRNVRRHSRLRREGTHIYSEHKPMIRFSFFFLFLFFVFFSLLFFFIDHRINVIYRLGTAKGTFSYTHACYIFAGFIHCYIIIFSPLLFS